MTPHPKNLVPFTFDQSAIDFSQFDEQLQELPLTEPGPLEAERIGFVPPSGIDGDPLVIQVDRFLAFAVGIKTKVIPSSVIGERLKAKVQELARKGTPVGRKQRRKLREEIRDELLRQAFCKLTVVRGWIDKRGRVFFDTSSTNTADACLSRLREAMGSFPAVPPTTSSVPVVFHQWVRAEQPAKRFGFGDSCVLSTEASGAKWTGKGVDLCGQEVSEHLDAGARFDRIGLVLDDRLTFTLDKNCVVRQLRCIEEAPEAATDDDERGIEADVLLIAGDASNLFAALAEVLGDESAGAE